MRRLSIDTNAYAAFMGGSTNIIQLLRDIDFIGLIITVIAELFSGFKLGTKESKNRDEFQSFILSPRVNILLHDLETVEFYAFIFKKLKTRGRPVPTNDIWIAANCLRHGLPLLTFDRHFEQIDGLMVIQPE